MGSLRQSMREYWGEPGLGMAVGGGAGMARKLPRSLDGISTGLLRRRVTGVVFVAGA